jgi:hypothetical protein
MGVSRLSILFGPRKQHLKRHGFCSNEKGEITLREWLRIQELLCTASEFLNFFQDEANTSVCSMIMLTNNVVTSVA